jgi:hypothetical protein
MRHPTGWGDRTALDEASGRSERGAAHPGILRSIGGMTYVKVWNTASSQGAMLLGQKAAEKPSIGGVGTQPPNTGEGGVGVGATTYAVPIPMAACGSSSGGRGSPGLGSALRSELERAHRDVDGLGDRRRGSVEEPQVQVDALVAR